MSLIYAVKRVLRMDISRVGRDIARVAKKSGKPRIFVFFDMLWCGVRYGAGPLDYDLFEFYSLTSAQRKTYVTRGTNNALVRKYNDKSLWHVFDNKNEFNEVFSDYISRDWLLTDGMTQADFEKFIAGKRGFIYKPVDGTCGRGIEKIDVDGKGIRELFEYIRSKPRGIIEELVTQHSALSAVYPLAINTIRVVTILKDGTVTPVFAFWRIGNNGKFVDNLNSGGMAALLDLDSGMVTLPAADKNGDTYECHPYTGKKIVGFKIPMWDKILSTVCSAAKVMPRVGYVGWDVALSQDSIQLIEGNCFPGHDIYRLPAYTPDKIGLMPRVEKFL